MKNNEFIEVAEKIISNILKYTNNSYIIDYLDNMSYQQKKKYKTIKKLIFIEMYIFEIDDIINRLYSIEESIRHVENLYGIDINNDRIYYIFRIYCIKLRIKISKITTDFPNYISNKFRNMIDNITDYLFNIKNEYDDKLVRIERGK